MPQTNMPTPPTIRSADTTVGLALRIAVLLAAVMAAGSLTGCDQKEDKPGGGSGSDGSATTSPASAPASDVRDEPDQPVRLTLTPLVSRELSPSGDPQSVAYEDKVKVTVPGGLLTGPSKLTISAVTDPPPPNHDGVVQKAVYDVKIDGHSQFGQDILIELPWTPTGLEASYPASALTWAEYYEPSMGVWFPVASSVNVERKTITIRTRHLSAFAVLTPQGGGDYKLWVVEEDPREALLVLHYNEPEVRKATIQFKNEKLSFELNKLDGDTLHGYLAKLAEYARSAVLAYRRLGLEPWAKPLHIYVGNPTRISSSYHNEWTGNIGFNTTADTLETLQCAISHEIFHSVQRSHYWPQTFPFRRSWLEATAEYAACRVAMPSYAYWGKLDKHYRIRKLATYLTKTLTYARARPVAEGTDPWANHEYAAAYFIDHVCTTGAALTGSTPQEYFASMFKAVAAEGDWDALEGFLFAQHGPKHSMTQQYADFAIDYLLAGNSPMYFSDAPGVGIVYHTTGPVKDAAVAASLALEEDGKEHLHTFHFPEALTTGLIKATCPSPKGKQWFAVVEAPEIPNDVLVTACRLKGDDRARGGESHRLPATVTAATLPKIHCLDKGDALYVAASSAKADKMVIATVKALPLESTPIKSSAKITLTPQPWGKAQCQLTLKTSGELISNAGMRKYVTEDSSYTNYPHVQILSPNYADPTQVSVKVEYELSKGKKYRHHDNFDVKAQWVDITIDNARLEVDAGSGRTALAGLSDSFRVLVRNNQTPMVRIYLVLDIKADFGRTDDDGRERIVKRDSSKASLLVVDLHGGGF